MVSRLVHDNKKPVETGTVGYQCSKLTGYYLRKEEFMETGFVIYNFDEPQMRVWWNKTEIHSEWLINWRHPKIPRYMFPENITKEGLSRFCESRQPPRTRLNIDYLLNEQYHLPEYMPIQMCRKSRGITHSDDLWLLFDGEEKPRYDDVTVR